MVSPKLSIDRSLNQLRVRWYVRVCRAKSTTAVEPAHCTTAATCTGDPQRSQPSTIRYPHRCTLPALPPPTTLAHAACGPGRQISQIGPSEGMRITAARCASVCGSMLERDRSIERAMMTMMRRRDGKAHQGRCRVQRVAMEVGTIDRVVLRRLDQRRTHSANVLDSNGAGAIPICQILLR